MKLFESDSSGKVTHLRGVELPPGIVHTVAVSSLSDRAPEQDTTWVIRGAYQFARRVQGITASSPSATEE